ncbi:TPA: ATP-binding cassette domain-containing protein [Enterobacter hormaechei subsp. steigerwaltii]|nr:ATP-binding cassette domain-containing protein [Enterobacter hormaechei subsp. steigerwaltii]
MLNVKNLTIAPLFREVNFRVPAGEIVTLMGPSGSGKSTLFAWMVGALSADFKAHGELWLNDRRCDMLPVETRGIGILFQDALLFDAFSVGQNLMLALPAHIVGRARVSLLRALLAQPQALLLDEPFSRLDKTLRASFRAWVFEVTRQRRIPVVLVTHDEDDIPPGGEVIEISRWQ